MAKKTNTPKKNKDTVVIPDGTQEQEANTGISVEVTKGELIADIGEVVVSKIAPQPSKRFIESMSVMELVWLEKACATICKKYETTARLDLENNKKLSEFSGYYKSILDELEDRVRKVCSLT